MKKSEDEIEKKKTRECPCKCCDYLYQFCRNFQTSREARVRLGKKVNYIKQFKQYYKVKNLEKKNEDLVEICQD